MPATAGELTQTELWSRDGQKIDLATEFASGKHVVLVFWQSWCSTCKAEAPGLAKMANELASQVVFIGVIPGPDKMIDDRRVDAFIESAGMTYPQIRDRDLSLTHNFAVKGTPTIIVIDPHQEVIYRGSHAPESWSSILEF